MVLIEAYCHLIDLRKGYEPRVGNYLEYQNYNLNTINSQHARVAVTGAIREVRVRLHWLPRQQVHHNGN
eukprot:2142865-Lingulodinium_polyedra.AAC.1